MTASPPANLLSFVSEYYGKLLASSADLKTNACCASGAPPAWIAKTLANVHPDVASRFYGCGFPIPHAIDGATVLDLGCGTGRDVFVLAQLVGPTGHVHGVDMTDEQLQVARDTSAWHAERFGYARANTTFHKGFIEDLRAISLADESMDVVVSNCVVNLSPRKDLVLSEIFRVLKPGGELYISDVFADRRLPPEIANDPVLYAECLGGAMYEHDFVVMAKRAGFLDPRVVSSAPITVQNDEISQTIGAARFVSVTYRLFKLADLDTQCEDYGQSARYLGGIPGAESLFWLDNHHAFERNRTERLCGNTAAMLASSRFAKYFEITGQKHTHFGVYACGPTVAATQYAPTGTSAGACC
ncbi:MAG: methyltransferase domain-containing protein [Deltaproteobacteria bacterium]|nr:methyltransferase domain-containing protein [Deltaproteobacteria bacterium]